MKGGTFQLFPEQLTCHLLITQQRELLLLARKTYKTHIIVMQGLIRAEDGSERTSGITEIRNMKTLDTFKTAVKTHFFNLAFKQI